MYKVIKAFTDLKDNNHVYHVGDSFPRIGAKVSDERLEELSTAKNRRGIPLIEKVGKPEKIEKVEKPKKSEAEKVEVVEEKATDTVAEEVVEAPKKRSRKKKEDVENAD